MMRAVVLMCMALMLAALLMILRAACTLAYWFGDGGRFAGVI